VLDGFNTQQEQRRRYPMPADKVYAAVLAVATRDYSVTSSDELTRTVMFGSHESGWTWGENITIMVLDAEGGCDVEISGVGKVGGQVQQATTLLQTFGTVFEKISAELTEGR
jgi:hypothetical protein